MFSFKNMMPPPSPEPKLSQWIVNTKIDSLDSDVMRQQTAIMLRDIRGLLRVSGLGKGKAITNVTFDGTYPEIGIVVITCSDAFIKLVAKLPSVGSIEPAKNAPKPVKNKPKTPPKGPKI